MWSLSVRSNVSTRQIYLCRYLPLLDCWPESILPRGESTSPTYLTRLTIFNPDTFPHVLISPGDQHHEEPWNQRDGCNRAVLPSCSHPSRISSSGPGWLSQCVSCQYLVFTTFDDGKDYLDLNQAAIFLRSYEPVHPLDSETSRMLEDFVGTRGRKHALITLQVARLDIIVWCLLFSRSSPCNLFSGKRQTITRRAGGWRISRKDGEASMFRRLLINTCQCVSLCKLQAVSGRWRNICNNLHCKIGFWIAGSFNENPLVCKQISHMHWKWMYRVVFFNWSALKND